MRFMVSEKYKWREKSLINAYYNHTTQIINEILIGKLFATQALSQTQSCKSSSYNYIEILIVL